MTNYYASPSGLDANAGTLGSPKLTIAGALAVATTSGDIVNLRAGDYAFIDTSLVRTNVKIQNYLTEAVTVSRAHGGTDWSNNAGIVMNFTGACTSCEIRRNPLGGSLTIRHTGTPSAVSQPGGVGYLAVGNAHLSYSGIRVVGGTGWAFTDLVVSHIFGYGININGSNSATVLRCSISDTATGVWTSSDATTVQDCDIFDNGYMLRDGPSEEDTGANGVQLSGATNWVVVNNDVHGNWSRTGSQQFGAEGGAFETFNVPTGSAGSFVGNRCWDNHNWMESGNNQAASCGGGVNAEVAYNVITGKGDYQGITSGTTQSAGGVAAGPNAASTSFILVRAIRDTWIHHNTFDVDDGASLNAGIRTTTGGTFGSDPDGYATNIVEDNAFYCRFGTPVHNFNGTGIPTGTTANGNPRAWTIRNNLIRYVANRTGSSITFNGDYSGNVFTGGTTPTRFNLSQGAAACFTANGNCSGDIWGDTNSNAAASDPKFVDADNATATLRDYRLNTGSAAHLAGHDASDVGAKGMYQTLPHLTLRF